MLGPTKVGGQEEGLQGMTSDKTRASGMTRHLCLPAIPKAPAESGVPGHPGQPGRDHVSESHGRMYLHLNTWEEKQEHCLMLETSPVYTVSFRPAWTAQ